MIGEFEKGKKKNKVVNTTCSSESPRWILKMTHLGKMERKGCATRTGCAIIR